MQSLVYFLVFYVYVTAVGAGFYTMLCPRYLRNPSLVLWLPGFVGAAVLTMACSWAIQVGVDVRRVPYPLLAASACVWPVVFAARRRAAWDHDRRVFRRAVRCWKTLVVVPACLVLLILAPLLKSLKSETAFHIGSDQVGYGIGAQYLLEGGRLDELKSKMLFQTGKNDLAEAIESYRELVDFTTAIQSNSLLQGRRWGVPAVTASLCVVCGCSQVFRCLYVPLAFFHCGLYFLTLWMLRTYWRMGRLWAAAGACAIALNCNLLNIIIEGGYAQTYTMPAFVLLWAMFAHRGRSGPIPRQGVSLAALLSSFVLVTYSDLFFVLAVLVVFAAAVAAVGFPLGLHRGGGGVPYGRIAMVAGLVAVVNGPFVVESLLDLPNKLRHNQAGGFWQPLWAWPAEILGMMDMYVLDEGAHLVQRPASFAAVSLCVSVACVVVVCLPGRIANARNFTFWGFPVLFVVGIVCKQALWDKATNYQYMKAYTYMLPFIWMQFWWRVCVLGDSSRVGRIVAAACAASVIGTGLHFQALMFNVSELTSDSMCQLREARKRCDLEERVIFTTTQDIDGMMLGGYFRMLCGTQGRPIEWKRFQPYLDSKVAVLIKRAGLEGWSERQIEQDAADWVVDTPDYLLVGLRHRLRDGFSEDWRRYDAGVFYRSCGLR